MSTRQRERAERRRATRARGNVPPEPLDLSPVALTPKGRAIMDNIMEQLERGVPIAQLGELERGLLFVVLAGEKATHQAQP